MGWIKLGVDETCHVTWVVRQGGAETYLHAIGDGSAGTRVTADMARTRFDKSRVHVGWLPVLFPRRAALPGRRSINCVTAAAGAMVRGWLYFP